MGVFVYSFAAKIDRDAEGIGSQQTQEDIDSSHLLLNEAVFIILLHHTFNLINMNRNADINKNCKDILYCAL